VPFEVFGNHLLPPFGRASARPEKVYDYAKYSATLDLALPMKIRRLRARLASWLCITNNYADKGLD
jgi:hypothetical protein